MTKAERAKLEDAETRAALAWPTFEEPTPLTVEQVRAIVADEGVMVQRAGYPCGKQVARFWSCNAYSGRVLLGCSDGNSIGIDDDWPGSQWRGDRLYRTHEEARRALAWAIARDCAKKLRQVELMAGDDDAA
jgi:hypothetical protein